MSCDGMADVKHTPNYKPCRQYIVDRVYRQMGVTCMNAISRHGATCSRPFRIAVGLAAALLTVVVMLLMLLPLNGTPSVQAATPRTRPDLYP